MSDKQSNLVAGRELDLIRQGEFDGPLLASLLRRIIDGVNTVATNTGTSPTGEAQTPPAIGGVNVKVNGETAHVTIQDANEVDRSHEWHLEYTTNDQFSSPHYMYLGPSREAFLNLPSKDDTGNPQKWYVRAYSQKMGSQPSAPVYYGGLTPTAIEPSGSTQLTPLSAPGSGTASPFGTQGGWGRGKIPVRPAQGPKRSVQS